MYQDEPNGDQVRSALSWLLAYYYGDEVLARGNYSEACEVVGQSNAARLDVLVRRSRATSDHAEPADSPPPRPEHREDASHVDDVLP